MERSLFLGRLTHLLAASPPVGNRTHPPPRDAGLAAARYRSALDDLPTAFAAAATANGSIVRRIGGPDGVASLLGEVVEAHRVRNAVVAGDPETQGVPALLEELGVAVLPWDGPAAAAAADLGVTGARCAVAATGSLVVESGRAGGRTASLLPPIHLALVPLASLVATPADVLRNPERFFPGGLPPQVVMITGPSKTADIEMVLVTGVHGPGHLWIGLVEET